MYFRTVLTVLVQVGLARGLGPGAPLPYLQLSVSPRGVILTPHQSSAAPTPDTGLYPIDTISYGVQDLVYTRVFAMIVVKVGRHSLNGDCEVYCDYSR